MDTTNPNERLADAQREHTSTLRRSQSLLSQAKAAHPSPNEYSPGKGIIDSSAQHLASTRAQNSFMIKANQVKGSGKSPFATPMSPVKGPNG